MIFVKTIFQKFNKYKPKDHQIAPIAVATA
jgi:hypothetical protein